MRRPDPKATGAAIARLFQPRSVAVVGASADPAKTAGRPIHFLRKHGFAGRILPVNPRADAIDGLPCYATVADLPETPDVGLVLLGAARAGEAVRALAERGTAAAIVLASGFAEAGDDGRMLQDGLREAAGGMRLLGPNTIGLVNLRDRIPLSASGALDRDEFPVGSVSVVSQSGGILGALLSRAAARGVGLARLVSTSNEADLDLADFLHFFATDPATATIALYVETIRDPARFRDAAWAAQDAGKRVVAFKVGRSESGARAAVSHTGALAGEDRMYDALFEQVGIVRAARFGEMLDIAAGLATGWRPRGRRVAILTSTGGAGTLVADALGLAGFDTPAPAAATAAALRALQTGAEATLDRNPIDVTLAGLRPDLLRRTVSTLLEAPDFDALAVVVGSSGVGNPALMAEAIRDSLSGNDKPVLAYVSPHAPEAASRMTALGVPAFTEPESCAAALQAMALQAPRPEPAPSAPLDLPPLPSGWLDESAGKALFARAGIPAPREIVVTDAAGAAAAAATLGAPVVLKVLAAEIPHKSEVGGVALGQTEATIADRLARMSAEVARHTGTPPRRFVVQETVRGGVELILGMRRDALGTAILLGAGGVVAELFRDTALRLLPPAGGLGSAEASAMAKSLRTWPLLDGFRGRPRADVPALVQAVVGFSTLVAQLGDRLIEAEINPLFVLDAGQGVVAADAVVALAAT